MGAAPPPKDVALLAGAVAAVGRLWTRNLTVAFAIALVAFSLTMVPFAVIFFEAALTNTLYASFVKAIDELYFGLIAITVSSILNYVEAQDGKDIGRICACLTAICVLLTITAVVGYSYVHFLGKVIFDPARDEGGFAIFTLTFAFLCVAFSLANILELRRMKDRIADFGAVP